jgi:hypothetical protein
MFNVLVGRFEDNRDNMWIELPIEYEKIRILNGEYKIKEIQTTHSWIKILDNAELIELNYVAKILEGQIYNESDFVVFVNYISRQFELYMLEKFGDINIDYSPKDSEFDKKVMEISSVTHCTPLMIIRHMIHSQWL